jgi:hypothetical protein
VLDEVSARGFFAIGSGNRYGKGDFFGNRGASQASVASNLMPTRHFAATGLEKKPRVSFLFIDARLT